MNLFDLSGQTAVVIGATGVLGGALAEGLAAAGARTAVLGRNASNGKQCVDRITATGGNARFFSADALAPESLASARDLIESEFGPVSILVNAAGGNDPSVTVTPENRFEPISAESWRANLDLNLAAQAAVLSLTQFLAREWAPAGVRVNSITPGFFPAEQNRKLLFEDDGSPTPRAAGILAHTPMARFGTASELVGAAVFLASNAASSFVTGTDVRVDGGFLGQTI